MDTVNQDVSFGSKVVNAAAPKVSPAEAHFQPMRAQVQTELEQALEDREQHHVTLCTSRHEATREKAQRCEEDADFYIKSLNELLDHITLAEEALDVLLKTQRED